VIAWIADVFGQAAASAPVLVWLPDVAGARAVMFLPNART
jgi:hypothetical protein